MCKKIKLLVTLAIILTMLPSTVLAAYSATWTVKETAGTDYAMLPVIVSIDNDWLATNSFIAANGLDTRLRYGGVDRPLLIADDKTLFAMPVSANTTHTVVFSSGNTPVTSMPIIVGQGGYITRTDHADLELGDTFTLEIDCGLYVTGDLLDKLNAIKISYDAATDILTVQTGDDAIPDVTLTASLPSGEYILVIQADGTDIELFVDGVLEDTDTVVTVPDSGNDWVLTPLPYINYFSLISGVDYGERYIYNANGSGERNIITIDTNKILVQYYDISSGAGIFKAVVGVIDEFGEITFGTPVNISAYTGGNSLALATFDTNKFVIVQKQSSVPSPVRVFVCSVSGTTITIGTPVDMLGASSRNQDVCAISTTKVAITYYDATTKQSLVIGEISGNTISFGNPVQISAAAMGGEYCARICAIDTNKVAISYVESGTSPGGTDTHLVVVATIAGTVPTLGTPETVVAGSVATIAVGMYTDIVKLDTDKFVVAREDLDVGWNYIDSVTVGTVIGDAITLGLDYESANTTGGINSIQLCAIDSTKFYLMHNSDDPDYDYGINYCTVAGTIINVGAFQDILDNHTSNNPTMVGIVLVDENKVCLATTDKINIDCDFWIDTVPVPYAEPQTPNGELLYQPVTIISGTTLLDNESTFDGVITWGVNPVGVATTATSGMSSSAQTVNLGDDGAGTSDILPDTGGSDWDDAPDVGGSLLTNPLRPLVIAVSDNTTLSERQVWVLLGIIATVFTLVLVGSRVRGHHLITGIAVSIVLILMIVWTVFPLLTLIVVVMAIVGGLLSERSPSL